MAGPQGGTAPPPTSRRRPPPTGDEEATSRLKLGDMAHEQALSPAEVTLLLDQLEKAGRPNNTEIYYKTREYCRHFARFKDGNSITQVNHISTELTEREAGITQYERAQLATLCCDTAEEARTLIPSLDNKITDEELQIVLDDISKLRDFS